MLAVERLQLIEEKLKENKVVLVSELSKEIQVTEETIRKDLEKLEKRNLICRVHGGAYLREGYGIEASMQVRSQIYKEEKELLANLCMNYIGEQDSLMLDGSTTSVSITNALVTEGRKITVITNSLSVAGEAAKGEQIRLIVLGGTFNRNTYCFSGNITLDELKNYHADKAIISGAGISREAGLTEYTQEEADLRRVMIKQARECIYVADSTKLGRKSVYVTGELTDIDVLLTDRPVELADRALCQELARLGIDMEACR